MILGTDKPETIGLLQENSTDLCYQEDKDDDSAKLTASYSPGNSTTLAQCLYNKMGCCYHSTNKYINIDARLSANQVKAVNDQNAHSDALVLTNANALFATGNLEVETAYTIGNLYSACSSATANLTTVRMTLGFPAEVTITQASLYQLRDDIANKIDVAALGIDLTAIVLSIIEDNDLPAERRQSLNLESSRLHLQSGGTSVLVSITQEGANDTSTSALEENMSEPISSEDLTSFAAAVGTSTFDVSQTPPEASSNEEEPYIPMAYKPSAAVEQFHSWPRAVGTNNITLQSEGDQQEEYAKGMASVIGPYLTIAILTLLCLPCFHCIRNWKCDETCRGKGSKAFYFFCLAVVGVACFIGFLSNDQIGTAIDGFAQGFGDLGRLFSSGYDNAVVAKSESDSAIVALTSLQTNCASSGNTDLIDAIETALDTTTDAGTGMQEFSDAAEPVAENAGDIESTLTDINPLREKATLAALAFSLLTFLIGGIHEAMMCHDGTGWLCTYYLVVFLGMIVMLGSWSTGGVTALLGVAISDVCMDPINLLATVANTDSEAAELRNLFWCNQTSELYDGLRLVQDNIPLLELNILRISSLGSANDCGVNYTSDLGDAETAIDALIDSAVKAFEGFNCPAVADIASNLVLVSLCTDTTAGAQLYLTAATLIGIFGLFALCVFQKETEDQEKNFDDVDMGVDDDDVETQ